jgi:hypothetical protein
MASRSNGGKKSRRKPAPGTAMVPALVPQPKNWTGGTGALLSGGMPGNKGGGRPPSAIRATARNAFDEVLPLITKIVKAKDTKDIDKIRGADVLGRYGMGHPVSIDDVLSRWRQQIDVIREFLPPEQSEPLLAQLRPLWMDL